MASDEPKPDTTDPNPKPDEVMEDAPAPQEKEQPEVEPSDTGVVKKSEEREEPASAAAAEEVVKNDDEMEGTATPEASKKKSVKRDRKAKPKEEAVEDASGGKAEGEAVTPRERPARERKAVERYWVATPASRSTSGKSLAIEKGSGTPLKEIPNVAYKLSKRKPDDNLQLLHTILYGKKAKVHKLKKDIGLFSGFVWTDNEEKQRAKTKEKLDKCVKEKLLDFCDLLNIPVNKSTVKKEDLTVKLLEFLESPEATTEELLADKEKKAKNQKTKASSKSKSPKGASAEKSAKKSQSGEKRKRTLKAEEENDADDHTNNLESQSQSSEEENDDVEKQVSDEGDTESAEEAEETKMLTPPKGSSKDKSAAKSGKKPMNTDKHSSEKPAKSPAKSEKKTPVASKKSAATAVADASASKTKGSTSKKQKTEDKTSKEEKVPAADKSTSKKQASKSASKERGKGNSSKEAKEEPTNEELRAQAVNILKEVDFNTATLSDILRLLGTHFGLDLMHRKVEVKAIITDVIENMSNPDDEDDEDGDDEAEDSEKE